MMPMYPMRFRLAWLWLAAAVALWGATSPALDTVYTPGSKSYRGMLLGYRNSDRFTPADIDSAVKQVMK